MYHRESLCNINVTLMYKLKSSSTPMNGTAMKFLRYITPENTCKFINTAPLKAPTVNIWGKVFKIGTSKICGRQPLKYLK